MKHLKTLTMISMETKVVSRDSFLDKLSENFPWMDSEKGNMVFARGRGGGGGLVFEAQNAWLG